MLVLSRRIGEVVEIGQMDGVYVELIDGQKARFSVMAPQTQISKRDSEGNILKQRKTSAAYWLETEQKIYIGDDIVITLLKISADRVSIGIDAPPAVLILRGELHEALAA